jgi:hypothetical protein
MITSFEFYHICFWDFLLPTTFLYHSFKPRGGVRFIVLIRWWRKLAQWSGDVAGLYFILFLFLSLGDDWRCFVLFSGWWGWRGGEGGACFWSWGQGRTAVSCG